MALLQINTSDTVSPTSMACSKRPNRLSKNFDSCALGRFLVAYNTAFLYEIIEYFPLFVVNCNFFGRNIWKRIELKRSSLVWKSAACYIKVKEGRIRSGLGHPFRLIPQQHTVKFRLIL